MTHLHIQTFRLLPGMEDQFLSGSQAFDTEMIPKLKAFGLLAREVLRSDDGQWTIMTRWESAEALHKAMQGESTPPAFMAAIDPVSRSKSQHDVVSSTQEG